MIMSIQKLGLRASWIFLSTLSGAWSVPTVGAAPLATWETDLSVQFETRLSTCGQPVIAASVGGQEIGVVSADWFVLGDPSRDSDAISALGETGLVRIVSREFFPTLVEIREDAAADSEKLNLWRRLIGSLLLRDQLYPSSYLSNDKSLVSSIVSLCPSCRPDYLVEQEMRSQAMVIPANTTNPLCLLGWGRHVIGLGSSALLACSNAQVGIVDSHVDLTYPALSHLVASRSSGLEFSALGTGTEGGTSHGSIMARIIAGGGFEGLCDSVQLVPIRVLAFSEESETACGFYSRIIAGLNHAAANEIPIVNFSLTLTQYDKDLEAAFTALAANTLILASAGESGAKLKKCAAGTHCSGDGFVYPISWDLDNVVAVTGTITKPTTVSHICVEEFNTALNHSDSLVDLAAPFRFFDQVGTSISTAFVTGAAAAIKHETPNITAGKIKDALLASTEGLTSLNGHSAHGRLCVQSLAPTPNPGGTAPRRCCSACP